MWPNRGWVMSHLDRGHHFSDQPITLMDVIGSYGFAGHSHAYGSWSACHVCLLKWSCYGSSEGRARLELELHLPMSAALLLWSWVSGGSQSLHFALKICDLPLTQTVQYFFFFGNCPSLIYNPVGLCHSFWCSVCLTTFILYTSLIPPGENLSAAFDPTYIFMSCEHPQCSIEGQLQVWACGQGQWQDSYGW